MYRKNLLHQKCICTPTAPEFHVKYYITEETDYFYDKPSSYGILIEKYDTSEDSEVFSANGCFSCFDDAKSLLRELYKYTVTPMSADESIDVILGDVEKFIKCPKD